jgi:hypothetical protein
LENLSQVKLDSSGNASGLDINYYLFNIGFKIKSFKIFSKNRTKIIILKNLGLKELHNSK